MLISTWHRTIDDRPPKLVESVHVQNNKRPTTEPCGTPQVRSAEGRKDNGDRQCYDLNQQRGKESDADPLLRWEKPSRHPEVEIRAEWERPTLSQSSGTDSVSWSGRFLNCCLICTNAFSLFDFPNPSSFSRMHLRACVSSLTGLALWCWELRLTYIPKINQQYVHNL